MNIHIVYSTWRSHNCEWLHLELCSQQQKWCKITHSKHPPFTENTTLVFSFLCGTVQFIPLTYVMSSVSIYSVESNIVAHMNVRNWTKWFRHHSQTQYIFQSWLKFEFYPLPSKAQSFRSCLGVCLNLMNLPDFLSLLCQTATNAKQIASIGKTNTKKPNPFTCCRFLVEACFPLSNCTYWDLKQQQMMKQFLEGQQNLC